MPHCGDCLRFYPSVMPAGCPFCDMQKYHTEPYCQVCRTKAAVPEVDTDGRPLRPVCPNCGQGPMLPSSRELMRRMTLDIKILPFVPTREEIAQALMDAEKPVAVDGTTLGQVSIRRTQGPVELHVQSALIEDYFGTIAATFHGEDHVATYDPYGGSPKKVSSAAQRLAEPLVKSSEGGPFVGMKYYKVPLTGESFFNPAGTFQYHMRGFGGSYGPPGLPSDRYRDMSFLMAVGLKEGVTFRFPIVASDTGLVEILSVVKDGMVAFYTNYMRPASHNVIIAIRHEAPEKPAPRLSTSKYAGEPLNAPPAPRRR